MNILVSVVIPTYNHADFLKKSLQSVLGQTYPYWEALVIDNHSQDTTDDVVKSFNDPRIRLLKIHNHGIIAASRNYGIREARGEWVAFLDSDDRWYDKKLETIIEVINNEDGYDVLCNDEMMVDVKTGIKRILRHGPYKDNFYRTLLIEGNRLSPSATIVRHDFLKQHCLTFSESVNYITVEDYDLWLNLARKEAKFKFIHKVLGDYVIHGSNNSAQLTRHWENSEALLFDHVYNVQKFHPLPDLLWKYTFPQLYIVQVRQYLKSGQMRRAFQLMLKTLFSSPLGTWVYLFSKIRRHY